MNEDEILQILLGEFRTKLNSIQNLVKREVSLPKASNKIKVAIGMRRVGKTFFAYQNILNLLENEVSLSQILYLNFEDDRLLPTGKKKLANLIEAFYSLYPENHDKKCYLFLDEIQNVDEWPSVIRRIHDTKNVEIFLTGSSAKLLSKEIATNLRGRSLATEIFPYSFKEFLIAKKVFLDQSLFDTKTKHLLIKLFRQYISEGGFPEITEYSLDVKQQTLQEYIDVVIYRDIIERHKIKNPSLIKYMIKFIIHNIASPFSINKFYNDLKSKGYKTGKDVLYEYAEYIEDTFLAFFVPIYGESLRKIQSNPKKVYAVDPGLVRAYTLDYEKDFGKLFENIVYLDLRKQGCKIQYYLTSNRYEVDFVATSKTGQKKLFQVVWDIENKETKAREERALQAAMDELCLGGEIITLKSYLQHGIQF